MDILVLLKRVPDTETRVKVAADGKSLDPSGVQYIMAPYDEIAVEEALQLRDQAGGGTVTVVTLGPPEAAKELRTALAMGADAAVHATTADAGDALATARALASAIEGRPLDLLLLGRQATDVDDAAVGPMLAALLGLPCATFASSLEVADGKLRVSREMEGETEVLELELPAVVTAEKGLAEPRYPGLKGIMAAKKKPLETREASPAESAAEVVALELPPTRGQVTFLEPTAEGVKALFEALRNEKKVL